MAGSVAALRMKGCKLRRSLIGYHTMQIACGQRANASRTLWMICWYSASCDSYGGSISTSPRPILVSPARGGRKARIAA